ncbi:MAG: dockerin type I domain-containing protein [Chthoniobacterales bacterium]
MKFTRSALLIAVFALAASPWKSVTADAVRPFLHMASPAHGLNPVPLLIPKEFQPLAAYMVDDGTSELPLGWGNGEENFEAIFFNQFNVTPGVTTIHSVSIAWGGAPNPGASPDGILVKIGVWSDPNGDGTPDDATVLGSVAGLVQDSNTNTFITYCFDPPVELPPGATSFFVGNMTPSFGPEVFPQGLDESASQQRSWVAGNSDAAPINFNHPGNNDVVDLVDSFGLPGNWLIRADDLACDESLLFVVAASIKDHFRVELPLTGPAGVESRSGGVAGKYNIYLTFNHSLTSVGGATTSCGDIGRVIIDPRDAHNVLISLTNVSNACNGSYLNIAATDIIDETGHLMSEAAVTMGLLIGDVTGNKLVDQDDLQIIRRYGEQSTSTLNFRSDVDVDGFIDQADFRAAKRHLGASLP